MKIKWENIILQTEDGTEIGTLGNILNDENINFSTVFQAMNDKNYAFIDENGKKQNTKEIWDSIDMDENIEWKNFSQKYNEWLDKIINNKINKIH